MMELSIKERILIRELLPENGNMIQMMLVKGIINKVDFTPKEIEEKSITYASEGQVTWNVSKDIPITIILETAEIGLLKSQIDSLDKEHKISQRIVDLCVKIKDF